MIYFAFHNFSCKYILPCLNHSVCISYTFLHHHRQLPHGKWSASCWKSPLMCLRPLEASMNVNQHMLCWRCLQHGGRSDVLPTPGRPFWMSLHPLLLPAMTSLRILEDTFVKENWALNNHLHAWVTPYKYAMFFFCCISDVCLFSQLSIVLCCKNIDVLVWLFINDLILYLAVLQLHFPADLTEMRKIFYFSY